MVRPSRGSPALEYLSVPPPWLIGVLLNSVRPTGPGGPGGGGGVPVGVLLHAATKSSRTGRTARRTGASYASLYPIRRGWECRGLIPRVGWAEGLRPPRGAHAW